MFAILQHRRTHILDHLLFVHSLLVEEKRFVDCLETFTFQYLGLLDDRKSLFLFMDKVKIIDGEVGFEHDQRGLFLEMFAMSSIC